MKTKISLAHTKIFLSSLLPIFLFQNCSNTFQVENVSTIDVLSSYRPPLELLAVAPGGSAPIRRLTASTSKTQKVSPPLVDYWQPTTGKKYFENAWIAEGGPLGNSYCQKKFGADWVYDSLNSTTSLLEVNICNLSVEVDSSGRIYCSEGVSGSNFKGKVFTTISCKTEGIVQVPTEPPSIQPENSVSTIQDDSTTKDLLLGSAADNACNLNSVKSNCWLGALHFMNSEYDYTDPATGIQYTASSSLNSPRNSKSSASFTSVGSLIYTTDCSRDNCSDPKGPVYTRKGNLGSSVEIGDQVNGYWTNIKSGFMKSPDYPNVVLFSKMQSPFYTPEVFRFDNNSIYVMSEPRFGNNAFASYYTHPGGASIFADRGYFWSFAAFQVKEVSQYLYRASRANLPMSGFLAYNLGGYKTPLLPTDDPSGKSFTQGYGPFIPSTEGRSSVEEFADMDLLNSSTAGDDWYNYAPIGVHATDAVSKKQKTGNLPPNLHVLMVTKGAKDSSGTEIWMERYYYGMRRNGEALGMIGYDQFMRNTELCPSDWKPAVDGAVCWGQLFREKSVQYNRLKRAQDYNQFNDENRGNYKPATALSFWNELLKNTNAQVHNPKLVARNPNTEREIIDTTRSHLRGAFKAPGNGFDFNGKAILKDQVIGLESNPFAHDWYLYQYNEDQNVNGSTQCRVGYQYLGSFIANKAWSGLNRKETQSPQWIILCGTTSKIAYLSGGSSCPTGYRQRGSFFSELSSYVSADLGKTFYSQPPNSWVQLCVRSDQALVNDN